MFTILFISSEIQKAMLIKTLDHKSKMKLALEPLVQLLYRE